MQDNFEIFCFGSSLSLMYVYTNTLYLIEFPLLFQSEYYVFTFMIILLIISTLLVFHIG